MRRRLLFALVLTVTMVFADAAHAADPVALAANLGSQLGKAAHCGFDTDEFARRAGRAIDAQTPGPREREQALRQLITAGHLAAKTGPVGESCSDFRKGFDASLRILRERGY